MSVAVTRAVEAGATGVVCASTGNTAASAAAYAARAGHRGDHRRRRRAARRARSSCRCARSAAGSSRSTDRSATRTTKRFDSRSTASCSSTRRTTHRIEGQKTAAFEIVEQLGGLPDVLLLPYGGGGNTKAYARGFREKTGELPRFHPTEAENRADTVASAIRIVEPNHREEVEDRRGAVGRRGRDGQRRRADRGLAPARLARKASSASPRPPPASPPSCAVQPSRASASSA